MNKQKCTETCYVDCPLYIQVEYIHNAESLLELSILCTTSGWHGTTYCRYLQQYTRLSLQ